MDSTVNATVDAAIGVTGSVSGQVDGVASNAVGSVTDLGHGALTTVDNGIGTAGSLGSEALGTVNNGIDAADLSGTVGDGLGILGDARGDLQATVDGTRTDATSILNGALSEGFSGLDSVGNEVMDRVPAPMDLINTAVDTGNATIDRATGLIPSGDIIPTGEISSNVNSSVDGAMDSSSSLSDEMTGAAVDAMHSGDATLDAMNDTELGF